MSIIPASGSKYPGGVALIKEHQSSKRLRQTTHIPANNSQVSVSAV